MGDQHTSSTTLGQFQLAHTKLKLYLNLQIDELKGIYMFTPKVDLCTKIHHPHK